MVMAVCVMSQSLHAGPSTAGAAPAATVKAPDPVPAASRPARIPPVAPSALLEPIPLQVHGFLSSVLKTSNEGSGELKCGGSTWHDIAMRFAGQRCLLTQIVLVE